MGQVKCSVTTCKYNEGGAFCEADEIKVKDNLGTTDVDMEFGAFEDLAGARSTVETCCETFTPKTNAQ